MLIPTLMWRLDQLPIDSSLHYITKLFLNQSFGQVICQKKDLRNETFIQLNKYGTLTVPGGETCGVDTGICPET